MASFRLEKCLSSVLTNWCGSLKEEDKDGGMRGGGLEENTSHPTLISLFFSSSAYRKHL